MAAAVVFATFLEQDGPQDAKQEETENSFACLSEAS
jgi:hypothetical protein